jgi:tripartite-type tricarboxylate transporter receptor subunit TctC
MRNLQELLATAREKPESLSYGMSGNGTSAHLAGEHLNYMAKVKIQAIPCRGVAPALTAVIAGEIPMSVNPLPEVDGQLDGNAARAPGSEGNGGRPTHRLPFTRSGRSTGRCYLRSAGIS